MERKGAADVCQESEDLRGRRKAEGFLSYVFKHAHCPMCEKGIKIGKSPPIYELPSTRTRAQIKYSYIDSPPPIVKLASCQPHSCLPPQQQRQHNILSIFFPHCFCPKAILQKVFLLFFLLRSCAAFYLLIRHNC